MTQAFAHGSRALSSVLFKSFEAITSVFFLAKPMLVIFEAYRKMDDMNIEVQDLIFDIISMSNNIWNIMLSGLGERCRDLEKDFIESGGMLGKLKKEIRVILTMIIAFDTIRKPRKNADGTSLSMSVKVKASILKQRLREARFRAYESGMETYCKNDSGKTKYINQNRDIIIKRIDELFQNDAENDAGNSVKIVRDDFYKTAVTVSLIFIRIFSNT